jgi:hypothetical protein
MMRTNPNWAKGSIVMTTIAEIVSRALTKALKPESIKVGIATTSIYPLIGMTMESKVGNDMLSNIKLLKMIFAYDNLQQHHVERVHVDLLRGSFGSDGLRSLVHFHQERCSHMFSSWIARPLSNLCSSGESKHYENWPCTPTKFVIFNRTMLIITIR